MPTVTNSATLIAAIDQLSAVLAAIFTLPNPTDAATIWTIAFATPAALYLASWAVGKVVNFWRN